MVDNAGKIEKTFRESAMLLSTAMIRAILWSTYEKYNLLSYLHTFSNHLWLKNKLNQTRKSPLRLSLNRGNSNK